MLSYLSTINLSSKQCIQTLKIFAGGFFSLYRASCIKAILYGVTYCHLVFVLNYHLAKDFVSIIAIEKKITPIEGIIISFVIKIFFYCKWYECSLRYCGLFMQSLSMIVKRRQWFPFLHCSLNFFCSEFLFLYFLFCIKGRRNLFGSDQAEVVLQQRKLNMPGIFFNQLLKHKFIFLNICYVVKNSFFKEEHYCKPSPFKVSF